MNKISHISHIWHNSVTHKLIIYSWICCYLFYLVSIKKYIYIFVFSDRSALNFAFTFTFRAFGRRPDPECLAESECFVALIKATHPHASTSRYWFENLIKIKILKWSNKNKWIWSDLIWTSFYLHTWSECRLSFKDK